MGITALSLDRINRYLKPTDSILLIGCQNCYWAENYGEIAQSYFEERGHFVKSIDILGCNGSDVADLRENLHFEPDFEMVNDCGSKEHVDGPIYWPFKNMHDACEVGGVMIHENPRFEHWPLHGQHYFSTYFYEALAEIAGYSIEELGEEPAMSNYDTGMNVYCVLRKEKSAEFLTEKQFEVIYNQYIYAK